MGRNVLKNKIQRDERRGQIVNTALRLFSTRGLHGTKISDIAGESGFSQGLVYNYFSSKEQIYNEIIRVSMEKMVNACNQLAEIKLEPSQKIKLAISELLIGFEGDSQTGHYYLLISQASVSDSIPEETRNLINKYRLVPHKVIQKILKNGQRKGQIKAGNASQMAFLFWSLIRGIAIGKAIAGKDFKAPNAGMIEPMFLV